jgi:hypothetical protein
MLNRAYNLLENYFFRPSQLSIEVARITFGFCSILIFQFKQLVISGNQVHTSWNVSNYFPKGILALFGNSAPTIETIDLWMFLQFWSALFLIFGLFSRASLVVNFFANLLLISLSESFSVGWSHGYNLNLLAQMPFIFAPVGRLISIDFFVRKYLFKVEAKKSFNAMYVWMTNFGIVAIFFNAFFWKLFSDRQSISLKWALSDNFRNQLIIRYSYVSEEIPTYLDFIVNSQFWWQLIAFLNLSFQALPFLSLFFLRMPIFRFVFGFLFVIEEIGLAVVMQLFDWHWIPLILLFIDWDYMFSKSQKTTSYHVFNSAKSKVILCFYGVYLFAYLSIAFCFYLPFGYYANEGGINSYPFSTYSMYSTLLNKNENGLVKMLGFDIDLKANALLKNKQEKIELIKKINRRFYGYHCLKDSIGVKNALVYLKKYLSSEYHVNADSIAIKRTIYEFTTYPEKAGVKKYVETNIGILNNDKLLYAYPKLTLTKDSIFIDPILLGFNKPEVNLMVYNYTLRKVVEIEIGRFCFHRTDSIFQGNKVLFILSVFDDRHYFFSGFREKI